MADRILTKPALFLLGLVLLAHLPALRAVEFHYDDGHSLVRNPHVKELANLPRFFVDPSLFSENPTDAMYRPVVLVAHTVSQWLTPDSASGYLGLNLALHGAATLLLFRVLTVLLSGTGALLGASLFALHPLQTEVVNYVSARSESLMAVGILLAVLAFLRYRSTVRTPWLWALAGGQFLALGAKEIGVITPLLLLTIQWLLPAGQRSAARRAQMISVLILFPYLILYQSFKHDSSNLLLRPMATQLATQIKALVHYLQGFLTPIDLSVAPQFSPSASVLEATVMLAAAALGSGGALLWMGRRRFPELGLAALWWLICLSPTLVVPLNVLVNDHRPYLALGGIALGAGSLMPRRPNRVGWILKVILGLVLVGLCWQRASDWRSEISLWKAAVREGPSVAAAHHNLAFAYHQQERTELARQHYERAVALAPDYTRPLTNLGALYRDAGQLQQAEEVLLRAVRSDPGAVEPLNNLGLVYAAQGRSDQALQAYQAALQSHPEVADVWFNLGLAQRDAGRTQEAFQSLQRALQLDPGIRQRLGDGGR